MSFPVLRVYSDDTELESLAGGDEYAAAIEAGGYRVNLVASVANLPQMGREFDYQIEAVLLTVADEGARLQLAALLRVLRQINWTPPILLSGQGIDESAAVDLALGVGPAPYQGGIYYVESPAEAASVLRNVIGFQHASVTSALASEGSGNDCDACGESRSCRLPGSSELCNGDSRSIGVKS